MACITEAIKKENKHFKFYDNYTIHAKSCNNIDLNEDDFIVYIVTDKPLIDIKRYRRTVKKEKDNPEDKKFDGKFFSIWYKLKRRYKAN